MIEITIEVPEAMAEQLEAVRDRLPEVLAVGLKELSPLPTAVYHYILEFVASNPSLQAVRDFKPTPEMQERISALLEKNRTGRLTPAESTELDEYERIEHYIRRLKIQALKDTQAAS